MEKEKINENVLKVSGKASLPEPLEIDHNYKVEIDGDVTSDDLKSNQDGTFTRYFRFEPILIKILKDNGEIIKAKDTRSRSQQLRSRLFKIWTETNANIEFETFYDEVMKLIIQMADDFVDRYFKGKK